MRPFPAEAALLAGASQVGPIVSSAMPHAAADRAGECVLRCHQEQLGAGLHDAGQFAQAWTRIGKMLENPAADDGIETCVGIGKAGNVSGDLADASAVQMAAGAL